MRSMLYCLICCLCLSSAVLAQKDRNDSAIFVSDGKPLDIDRQQDAFALPSIVAMPSPNSQEINRDNADTLKVIERLVELENNYAVIQNRIEQLEQKFLLITEAGERNKVKNVSGFYGRIQQYADVTRNYLGAQMFTVIIAGTIILLLALLVYLIVSSATRVRAKTSSMASYFAAVGDDDEDNFSSENSEDEMNSESKLNLARAYIDMEDYSKALTLLYEVMARGNNIEQGEAKELIDKIKCS